MSAVELSLTDVMDKVVVDDWGQCRAGKFGALRAHVDSGRLDEESLFYLRTRGIGKDDAKRVLNKNFPADPMGMANAP